MERLREAYDRRLITVSILGTLLTACASTSSGPSSSEGEVEPACCAPKANAHMGGALVGIGGPVGTREQHWAGTIRIRGDSFATVATDSRGHSSVRLPAGRFRFTGTSPSYEGGHGTCSANHPVRLLSHHTIQVRVICQLK